MFTADASYQKDGMGILEQWPPHFMRDLSADGCLVQLSSLCSAARTGLPYNLPSQYKSRLPRPSLSSQGQLSKAFGFCVFTPETLCNTNTALSWNI